MMAFCFLNRFFFNLPCFYFNSEFQTNLHLMKSAPKTIESIDSSKDKSSVPKIFEQISSAVRNSYGKDIVKKTIKKQKQRKERTKFPKLHFGEYNKLLQPVLLRFCVKGKGKQAFSIGDFLVPPTQD